MRTLSSWMAVWLSFVLTLAGASAGPFTVVHQFVAANGTGPVSPYANLLIRESTVYGYTWPGPGNYGTVFRVNTGGSEFFTIHVMAGVDEGIAPIATPVLNGDMLYGLAPAGGTDAGLIFRVNTNGTGFTAVHSFYLPNGVIPVAGLTLSRGTFYGLTESGGGANSGTIFKGNIDGTDYEDLHDLAPNGGINGAGTLLLDGDTLFGTTSLGNGSFGTVFAINTNGMDYADLHIFTPIVSGTNNDGADPCPALVHSGNMLYGTTASGGVNGKGTLFKVNADGTSFRNIHNFDAPPSGSLVLSGSMLYGTTTTGGDANNGMVFRINTDGSAFTNLYSFSPLSGGTNVDGAHPTGALVLSGATLYGTTSAGGLAHAGVLFALNVAPPQLDIQRVGDAVVLTWHDPGFFLQLAPSLAGDFNNLPDAISPYTNAITGSQTFFRLKSN